MRVSTVKTLLKNTKETQNQKAEPVPKRNLTIAEMVSKEAKITALKSLETDIIKVFITEK